MKYYARQSISESDIEAVTSALRSDFLTQGPATQAFEDDLRALVSSSHALVVSSATAALMIAYRAVLDEAEVSMVDANNPPLIWVPANTFVATANAARLIGAEVDFVDIDISTGNLDLNALHEKLRTAGRRPHMVVPVHFGGDSVDMKALYALSVAYEFLIVEDASHALGGWSEHGRLCAPHFSRATVTSFHAVKCIATGEGGAIFTDRPAIADRCALLRSHGVTRDSARMHRGNAEPWYYEQIQLGYNFRMSDIQAALGRSQLSRLHEMRAHKARLAECYRHHLNADVFSCIGGERIGSAYHLMPVLLPEAFSTTHKVELFYYFQENGYQFNVHYFPVNEQPEYRGHENKCPQALSFYHREVSLPLHAAITYEDVVQISNLMNIWTMENAA